MTAATNCREEAERDPSRRTLWLQEAERWTALARESVVAAISLEIVAIETVETISMAPRAGGAFAGGDSSGRVSALWTQQRVPH
ncbi:hypothetical protein ACQR1W_21100 [Bradyrhizobium sp. HKCCYLS1011]|uniref:hypothetical protein n=1 Tax=Bradyrhizobium sp. HKCCYLS1011 TaxID=3420733 RepID=UPI003EB8D577